MAIDLPVREAIDAFMERLKRDHEAQARALTSDLMKIIEGAQDGWVAELERAATDARSDAERAHLTQIETMQHEFTAELEARIAGERAAWAEQAAASGSGGPDGEAGTVGRLLATVRQLDQTTTLRATLETLAKGAAGETSRVAIFIVDGEMLRAWGHFGFAAASEPVDVPVKPFAPLLAAVSEMKTALLAPAEAPAQDMPAFMRLSAGHSGLVAPLVLSGEAVALLYADDVDRSADQPGATVWTEAVEVLVRHASIRLENVTSARTVEVLTRPA
jgi:hypothetical protein